VLLLEPGAVHASSGVLPVTGSVNVSSRLGQETIPLTGTATIQWGGPYISGGVLVVDTEITALNLAGNSLTGPVSVAESASLVSSGRNTGSSSSDPLPASTYFDVYVSITAPAAPNPTITLTNSTAVHLTAPTIYDWPPGGIVYGAQPNPCVPLLPAQPMQACLNAMSFKLGSPLPVGGIARLSGIASAPLAIPVASVTGTASDAVIAAYTAIFVSAGVAWLAWKARPYA